MRQPPHRPRASHSVASQLRQIQTHPANGEISPHQYAVAVAQDENPVTQQRLVALLTALETTEERLRQLGDDHWADWLRRDHARIARGDAYGLEHLKNAFGGMGSINDSYSSDDGDVGKAVGEIYGLAA